MQYRSPLPDITLPNTDVFTFVLGDLRNDADLPAITEVDTGRTVTYGELAARVEALAATIAPGEVIALRQPNSIDFAVGLLAILRAGSTVTLIGALLLDDEASTLKRLSHTTSELTLNEIQHGIQSPTAGEYTPPLIDPQSIAAVPFSSGTTGLPKAVELTHAAITANAAQFGTALRASGIEAQTRTFAPLPFTHIYGLNTLLLASLRARHHIHTTRRFSFEEMVNTHAKHGIELTFIAPPIARLLAKQKFDAAAFAASRFMVCGAASLDEELARSVERKLDTTILQGYGTTESAPVTHVGIAGKSTPGSIGFAVPNTQFRIVDLDTGEDAKTGELLIRGPQLMRGYRDQPPLGPGDWLHTGDLARLRDNGTVDIIDRVKDIFKYHGYQISPAELEAVLLTHPQVADAAVAGRKTDDGEEVPWGFVVWRGASQSKKALIAWMAERVAPYKKLRGITVIDEIPRNAAGKILRRNLPL
ncbi:AMP-binding protein [Corynebacterium riegelii]|uniref:AMP-binding protein n=1 Tax=Corynebacterium riegelii TaxID=156976 RepID=UPI00254D2AF1|nr:AMP-binding protein [Corynebacterium riegelii]MDK7180045.1 AMP-binding protein [Corynebacterium riegelii]